MDILVTGFGPFPRVRVNPTTVLARAVAARLKRSGLDARALVVETSYGAGLPALRAHLAATQPKAVLMLGLAARARFVRVELFARGHASPLHPDATGGTPKADAARFQDASRPYDRQSRRRACDSQAARHPQPPLGRRPGAISAMPRMRPPSLTRAERECRCSSCMCPGCGRRRAGVRKPASRRSGPGLSTSSQA